MSIKASFTSNFAALTMFVFNVKNNRFMLCISNYQDSCAYSLIELSRTRLSWVTPAVVTKAGSQRVSTGHLSIKRALFLVMLKAQSWRR